MDDNRMINKTISISLYLLFQSLSKAKVKGKSLSCVCLLATPWTMAHQVLCPWDFPGMNAEVGYHFLLQEIFLTQELNLGLHCRQILYQLSSREAS